MLRAGVVLALLLVVLGGVPQGVQVGASPAVAASIAQTASDLCGGGWGDKLTAHAPCHACRSATPLLPPAPCTGERAFVTVEKIAFAPVTASDLPILDTPEPLSRGPPARA
jgi:hypothetical protein